jgi:hypothetical protein
VSIKNVYHGALLIEVDAQVTPDGFTKFKDAYGFVTLVADIAIR